MVTFKKWSPQEVKEVKSAIRSVLSENKKAKGKVIAEQLNALQIRHPNKEQWSNQEVFSFLKRYPVRVIKTNAEPGIEISHVHKTHSASERLAVSELVLASALPTKDKERILTSIFCGEVL